MDEDKDPQPPEVESQPEGNDVAEGSGMPTSDVGEAVDVDSVRDRAS